MFPPPLVHIKFVAAGHYQHRQQSVCFYFNLSRVSSVVMFYSIIIIGRLEKTRKRTTHLARVSLPVRVTGTQETVQYGFRVSGRLEHVLTNLVFDYRNLHFLQNARHASTCNGANETNVSNRESVDIFADLIATSLHESRSLYTLTVFQPSPTSDHGHATGKFVVVVRHAYGHDVLVVADRWFELKQGDVVLERGRVVLPVHDDPFHVLADAAFRFHFAADVVLAEYCHQVGQKPVGTNRRQTRQKKKKNVFSRLLIVFKTRNYWKEGMCF